MFMKTAANTGLFKVVANGSVSIPLTKARAEKIAKALRSAGKMATVIAAKAAA